MPNNLQNVAVKKWSPHAHSTPDKSQCKNKKDGISWVPNTGSSGSYQRNKKMLIIYV